MLPFMSTILGDIIDDLLSRFILKDVLKKCDSLYQLLQLDINDRNIRKPAAEIDIGFASRLKVDQANLTCNDYRVVAFKSEAGEFLAVLLAHLFEKSPLRLLLQYYKFWLSSFHTGSQGAPALCPHHADPQRALADRCAGRSPWGHEVVLRETAGPLALRCAL